MSEVKHTPGPWQHRHEGSRHVIFIERSVGEAALAVAMTAGTHCESIANARLIAAAPAMFEALKPFANLADWLEESKWEETILQVAGFLPDGTHCSGGSGLDYRHLYAARAALSRAQPQPSDEVEG